MNVPNRFRPPETEQAIADMTVAEVLAIEPASEIERRQSILLRDVAYQEGRERDALVVLKADLAAIKLERRALREREDAARQAYAELVETTDALARASRAALKELP